MQSSFMLAAAITGNVIATALLIKMRKIEVDVVGKTLIALNVAAGTYGISFFI